MRLPHYSMYKCIFECMYGSARIKAWALAKLGLEEYGGFLFFFLSVKTNLKIEADW